MATQKKKTAKKAVKKKTSIKSLETRPILYNKGTLKKARDYVNNYQSIGDTLPCVKNLAIHLDVDPETLHRWSKEEGKEELSKILDEVISKGAKIKDRMGAYLDRASETMLTKLKENEDGVLAAEDILWHATLFEATGTTNHELSVALLNQAIYTKSKWHEDKVIASNEILTAMHDIRPQDIMEGMLGVQMVGVHNLAMECMKRVVIENQHPEAIHRYAKLANQFCRTYTAQLDALNKHRGKGQQKVTVEHVHVNEGGQAVVGNINQGGGQNEK